VAYLESEAWVTNLKHKLASGSTVVSPAIEYYEFFSRALRPGVHYVQVDVDDLCESVVTAVSASGRQAARVDGLADSWDLRTAPGLFPGGAPMIGRPDGRRD
jgi:Glycosyl transferase family 90